MIKAATKKFSLIYLIIFIIILFLFCYFRLKPIYFQTVGFTYDQGRDFLKAAELVTEHKMTFIGPTTGIQGLFHGAWWYYLLTIPFVLFHGLPIGFYYFNFIIQLISFFILFLFILNFFGAVSALLTSLIVATSPYFIFTSIFVGNNIMVLPVLLIFIILSYILIHQKPLKNNRMYLFLLGLSLGFVAEFEVAFGMFLIPSFFLLIILISELRNLLLKLNNFVFLIVGLTIPFIPRMLFEIKNNFLQTNALINNIGHGSAQNPNSFMEAYQGRISAFFGYFRSLFFNDYGLIIFLTLIIISGILLLQSRNVKPNKAFSFMLGLLGLFFLFSGLLKDSFFWGNYFEGIQYLYLILMVFYFNMLIGIKKIFETLLFAILILLIIFSLQSVLKDYKKTPELSDLKLKKEIVNYIQSKEKNKYCVKIYTPPVIPYTYEYLFLYNKISKRILIPEKDWVKNKCWFILENDDFKERKEKWLKDNLPEKNNLLDNVAMGNVSIKLYERL